MTNLLKSLLAILICLWIFQSLPAKAESSVNAYFFYGDGCPHCAKEEVFLSELLNKYPSLTVYTYEIYKNRGNADLLMKAAENLGVGVDGVPFLIIGDQSYVGYAEGISDQEIENLVKQCLSGTCSDNTGKILGLTAPPPAQEPTVTPEEQNGYPPKETIKEPPVPAEVPAASTEPEPEPILEQDSKTETPELTAHEPADASAPLQEKKPERWVNLPFFGNVNAMLFSLPALTITLGALDGFNPCAMWVLLFLISLLLGMADRKRMWILGLAFILSSAFVYFLFMVAWLKLILFLGFVIWIRILIGLVALTTGGYNLKEFLFNKNPTCKIAGAEKRQATFARLKAIVQKNSLWLALMGIILLAFMVNLVELICSAGLPAIYTQVLTLNNLPAWKYYAYILLYVFFFMLDDLLVFVAAMITLQVTGVTTKYTRAAKLIGGIIMLLIGIALIFKPEWVMFG